MHEFYEYLIHFMNGLLLNQRCYYWDNVYSDKRGQTSCVILHEFYCVPLCILAQSAKPCTVVLHRYGLYYTTNDKIGPNISA